MLSRKEDFLDSEYLVIFNIHASAHKWIEFTGRNCTLEDNAYIKFVKQPHEDSNEISNLFVERAIDPSIEHAEISLYSFPTSNSHHELNFQRKSQGSEPLYSEILDHS